MSILKLKNAGDEVVMLIDSAEQVQGQYGEQFKFSGAGDDLYVPKDSAIRQFERIGLVEDGEVDLSNLVGTKLHFSRTAGNKPGVVYWNISLGTAAKEPAKTNGAPPVAKAPAPAKSYANKPESELPEFLRDAAKQDDAELKAKIAGLDTDKIQKGLALYTAITEFVLRDIVPIYVKNDVGVSDQSVAAMAATLFIQANR